MSDAPWVQVAQAVTDEINDQEWSQEFTAERSYADWAITLEELGKVRVDVVPVNNPSCELDDAGHIVLKCPVDIAIRYRFKQDELTEDGRVNKAKTDLYCYLLWQITQFLTGVRIQRDGVDTVSDGSPEFLQTHGPQALLESQQYTGIVRTFWVIDV